jgi:hypothetical protein
MSVVTWFYLPRKTAVQRTLFACQPLFARQTHVFNLLYDMGFHLCSIRLWSQRRLLDDMRTALCRLFAKLEFPDLTILPSGTWPCQQESSNQYREPTHQRQRRNQSSLPSMHARTLRARPQPQLPLYG